MSGGRADLRIGTRIRGERFESVRAECEGPLYDLEARCMFSGGAFNGTITATLPTPFSLIYLSAAVHADIALPEFRTL